MTTELNGDYQQLVRDFVNKYVYQCIDSLIAYLAKDCSSEYYSNILDVINSLDWVTPAEEEGWKVLEAAGCYLFWNEEKQLVYDVENDETVESPLNKWDGECYQGSVPTEEDWRSLCENQNIDCQTVEAYEHWIVDRWFAEKLEAKGEMISYDIYGLVVWGRTDTNQEILVDDVVRQIYNEMMA